MTPLNDTPEAAASANTGVAQAPAIGFISSEFAVTAVTLLGLLLQAVPQQYAPLVAAVAGVYVAARTLLKAVHTLGYVRSIPDLPALPAGSTVTNVTTTQVPK